MSGDWLSWLAEPGAYHVQITGRATGFYGGAYALAQSAMPVPLSSALWVFIMGMAGLAAVIRRRRV